MLENHLINIVVFSDEDVNLRRIIGGVDLAGVVDRAVRRARCGRSGFVGLAAAAVSGTIFCAPPRMEVIVSSMKEARTGLVR